MTAIIALREDKGSWIGADTIGVMGPMRYYPREQKIWKADYWFRKVGSGVVGGRQMRAELLMATCGDRRTGQALRHFTWPVRDRRGRGQNQPGFVPESPEDYLYRSANAMMKHLDELGLWIDDEKDGWMMAGSTAMTVVMDGRIFHIDHDLTVTEPTEPWITDGSCSELLAGAVLALKRRVSTVGFDPAETIKETIKIASLIRNDIGEDVQIEFQEAPDYSTMSLYR